MWSRIERCDYMMAILDIYTNEHPASFVWDIVRFIVDGVLNYIPFWLLGVMYEIFFNVANAELLQDATIRNFYGRVQLIIGVFMVFRLSITVLQTIVDPDKVQDKKEGFTAIIKRVVIGLIMLTVLTPINVPSPKNDFERELNNNGLLFGTLYSLQYRILQQNTLGRLILGTTDNSTSDGDIKSLKDTSKVFVSTIAKGFMHINLVEGATDETKSENWMCGADATPEEALKEYQKLEADPFVLFGHQMVTLSCKDGKTGVLGKIGEFGNRATGKDRYVFTYIPIISTIVALAFAVILLGFTLDIAIRAIKLAILRLIAPIPIISYMGPESKENNAFSSWIRAIVSTYLDLFIRLAVVYFVMYIIIDLITNGIALPSDGNPMINFFSFVLICLGLYFFARQAPKFIMDALGIKSLGSNIGLGAILGGGAMIGGGFASGYGSARQSGAGKGLAIFGGLRGAGMGFAQGAMNGAFASNEAAATGKEMPLHNVYAQNRDLMAQIRTGDKEAKGGVAGYLQDRLNYQNRELRANSLGIGKNTQAAALYEDEWAGNKYREAQGKTASAASKVTAMKGAGYSREDFNRTMSALGLTHTDEDYKKYGGLMNISELTTKNGQQVSADEYKEFVERYRTNVDNWTTAMDEEEKARVQTLITGAAKKSIDNTRSSLGVAPRAADVYTKSYRSQSGIKYAKDEERKSTRIAVDSTGTPITSDRTLTGEVLTGKEARGRYQYERSTQSFDGTIDDSTFGSSGRGSG